MACVEPAGALWTRKDEALVWTGTFKPSALYATVLRLIFFNSLRWQKFWRRPPPGFSADCAAVIVRPCSGRSCSWPGRRRA